MYTNASRLKGSYEPRICLPSFLCTVCICLAAPEGRAMFFARDNLTVFLATAFWLLTIL